jgi:hypothetical protein
VFAATISPNHSDTCNRLFSPLLARIESINPRVFELPRLIRETFEGVLTHPHSGAYLDATEYEFVDDNGRTRRSAKRQRMLGHLSTPGGHADIGPTAMETSPCFKCGKTDLKLPSTLLLSSRAALSCRISIDSGEPILITDCLRSNMIKCDSCDLCWHYDCLDPPLADSPPRNLEKVDLNLIRDLRLQSWGGDAVRDWEWNDYIVEGGRSRRRRDDDILGGKWADESGDERNGLLRGSPTPFPAALIGIRRKWVCPCHAQWVQPRCRKRKDWSWIEVQPLGEDIVAGVGPEIDAREIDENDVLGDGVIPSVFGGGGRKPEGAGVCRGSSVGSSNPHPLIGTQHQRERRVVAFYTQDSRNDGLIEIRHNSTDDDLDRLQVNARDPLSESVRARVKLDGVIEMEGVKHCIPESRVRLDFLDKCRSLRSLVSVRSYGTSPDVVEDAVEREGCVRVEKAASQLRVLDERWESEICKLYVDRAEERVVDLAVATMTSVGSETGRSLNDAPPLLQDDVDQVACADIAFCTLSESD